MVEEIRGVTGYTDINDPVTIKNGALALLNGMLKLKPAIITSEMTENSSEVGLYHAGVWIPRLETAETLAGYFNRLIDAAPEKGLRRVQVLKIDQQTFEMPADAPPDAKVPQAEMVFIGETPDLVKTLRDMVFFDPVNAKAVPAHNPAASAASPLSAGKHQRKHNRPIA